MEACEDCIIVAAGRQVGVRVSTLTSVLSGDARSISVSVSHVVDNQEKVVETGPRGSNAGTVNIVAVVFPTRGCV